MATNNTNRAQKAAHAEKYAPRNKVPVVRPVVVEDARLRKLTAQTLDELKLPNAVPSRVIMAALQQAMALK